MIDTHAHLNLSPLYEDRAAVITRAQNVGVTQFIIPGTDLTTSRINLQIADGHTVFPAVGVHPEESNLPDLNQVEEELRQMLADPRVIAIGECGLDYCELQSLSEAQAKVGKNEQKRLFGLQISLAKEFHKPLIVHVRNQRRPKDPSASYLNAYADTLDTIRHFSTADGIIPAFVLHCASGNREYVEAALEMGSYISFAGNVTYKNAPELQDLLSLIPPDRLLLETDSPFLSPQSSRGSINEPAKIKETYEFVASHLQIPLSNLEALVVANARTFFGIV